MDITHVFCPPDRASWRAWLEANHQTAAEVWLQTHHTKSGKPRVAYDDAVEEALCFGWIDGITKKYDDTSSVQRYTPRRPKSNLSELNRQRIFKLLRLGKMTEAGLAPIRHLLGSEDDPLVIPDDVLEIFQSNAVAWDTFQAFPLNYQKLRMGFVLECRKNNPALSNQRLDNLIKMSEKGKMFGTVVE